MAERWTGEFSARARDWCEKVAGLGVDALVDAGLVARADIARAEAIVAEELFVRLCLHDYPPVPDSLCRPPDVSFGPTSGGEQQAS
jgi:hypothetical protein